MTTDTKLQELIINKLTTSQYDSIEKKDPNQIYIVTDAPSFDNTISNCLTHIYQDINLELKQQGSTLYAWGDIFDGDVKLMVYSLKENVNVGDTLYTNTNVAFCVVTEITAEGINAETLDDGMFVSFVRLSSDDIVNSQKTLVLNAGGNVCVPKGFEADGTTQKFDVVTIESDLIINVTGNGQFMITVQQTGAGTYTGLVSTFFSGATPPSISVQYAYWYDTTNNVIKYTSNTGSTWTNINCSLPIGIITVSSGVITSIDQIFNGFGYIGSTFFYYPKLQGKTANGLNSDGTYKGTTFTTTKVVTRTFSGDNGERYLGVYGSNLNITYNNYPDYFYDIKTNQYINTNENKEWADVCVLAICTMKNGVISNFRPKTTFQSVDRNELRQFELPTGSVISFAANSTPKGYLICNGAAVSRTTYAELFAVIGTTYGSGDGSTTFNLPNLTDKFIQGSGTAGTSKVAGLPNITGKTTINIANFSTSGASGGSGAIRQTYKTNYGWAGSNRFDGTEISIDASRSSSIYGKSSTVQPPALTMRFYIKY